MFYCMTENWAGRLILSPPEETVICEGENRELICATNETFLQWSWSLQIEQGKIETYSRFISSTDLSQQVNPVVMNSTLFNASRVSHRWRSPLVSRLVIYPMNISLNGTIKVNCTEVDATMNEMASFIINILGEGCKTIRVLCITCYTIIIDIHNNNYIIIILKFIHTAYSKTPLEVITTVEHGTDNVTVSLMWITKNHTSYTASAELPVILHHQVLSLHFHTMHTLM